MKVQNRQETAMTDIYDFSATALDGHEQSFADYRGKVLLIVNTASKCGFTSQYEGLQKLHEEYGPRGLVILGFPCNQFGAQEPGDAAEIASFCSLTYDVSFPMFAKIDVNGDNTHPLYRFLKSEKPGLLGTEGIKWNFTKFLVDRQGEVVERYAPATKPEELAKVIESLL
jgi:glutathione peroxidase